MQSALNQLAISVRRYGMCFAPSKCKVLLQDWQDSNLALTLDGEQIEVVEKLVYLGSCISAGGGVSDEINARIVKVSLGSCISAGGGVSDEINARIVKARVCQSGPPFAPS
ncbi:unnamed protein product [Schistosoma mattheei]|uniref:Uncharacterized protein n=1 Tax=Schistosoma mattheei TaxID=31246 RepID=A0A183NLQ2_9TREM|nr:unnamed protein product [Schistosoma mattheei]